MTPFTKGIVDKLGPSFNLFDILEGSYFGAAESLVAVCRAIEADWTTVPNRVKYMFFGFRRGDIRAVPESRNIVRARGDDITLPGYLAEIRTFLHMKSLYEALADVDEHYTILRAHKDASLTRSRHPSSPKHPSGTTFCRSWGREWL